MKTKRLLCLVAFATLTTSSFAQDWQQGGNGLFPPPFSVANPVNQRLGTTANFPFRFITTDIQRMHINENRLSNFNLYNNVNTDGFVGIGRTDLFGAPGSDYWNTQGPMSLLHLKGFNQGFVQDAGYRPWMQIGITITDNQDLMYVGQRRVGAGPDITENVITWADNAGVGGPGPDDLAFRFTTSGNGNIGTAPNQDATNDLDGRNIVRYTGTGQMGLGSTFGVPAAGAYVRPATQFHTSKRRFQQNWGLITNELGTGQLASDGLKWGIRRSSYFGGDNRTYGFLRWQENTPFIIQTDWNAGSGFGNLQGERMRIVSIGALQADPGYVGIAGNNTTRVAISHNGNAPIERPMSLLHLGNDVGGGLIPSTDGWRNWMDVGTFTADDSDNMYVGLKNEGVDRKDAVINWGDNQVPGVSGPVGPDNLRFIFTSTTTALPPGTGDPVSQSNDGLEVARMEPGVASTLGAGQFGMMGIGDYSPGSPNIIAGNPVDAKLDIDGDLRIRTLTQNNALNMVLVADPADLNRVLWRDAATLGGAPLSNNGIFTTPGGVVQLGATCTLPGGGTNTAGLAAVQLTADRSIPNRNFNFWFASLNAETGGVGFGGQPSTSAFCTTGNTVEISANSNNATYGSANASGLRLSKLTSASPTIPNTINGVNSAKVLTVDANGDVVLTDAAIAPPAGISTADNGATVNPGGNVQWGQINTGTGAFNGGQLLHDTEIPMDGNDVAFMGQGVAGGNRLFVGSQASPGFGTVNVNNNAQNSGLHAQTDATALTAFQVSGMSTRVINAPTVGYGILVEATSNTVATFNNIGVSADSDGALLNICYRGRANDITAGRSSRGMDVSASTSDGQSLGGLITAFSDGATITRAIEVRANNQQNLPGSETYGVFARAEGGETGYGVYGTSAGATTNIAGYFAGDVFANSYSIISDQMFKNNVTDLTNATTIINQLAPKTFDYDQAGFPQMEFTSGTKYGLIAQEVETVLPNLVSTKTAPAVRDSAGTITTPALDFKALDYEAFIPILIQGMKEQNGAMAEKDSLIDDLESRLAQLEACVSNLGLCSGSSSTMQMQDQESSNEATSEVTIELSDARSIILEQNVPNPFAEQTTIAFSLPEEVQKAQILFYNFSGKLINSVELNERGDSKINVFANDLSSGVYTYTLVADGQIIATKKMVKQQ